MHFLQCNSVKREFSPCRSFRALRKLKFIFRERTTVEKFYLLCCILDKYCPYRYIITVSSTYSAQNMKFTFTWNIEITFFQLLIPLFSI